MTLNDLLKKYYFHDSTIENIQYDKDNGKLIFTIDFCYWMQENHIENSKENGLIQLIFNEVTNYNWFIGEIDSFGIIDAKVKDDEISLSISDDFHDNYYNVCFVAKDVQFIEY